MDNEISFPNGCRREYFLMNSISTQLPAILTPNYYSATFSINSTRRKSAAGCMHNRHDSDDKEDSFKLATVIKTQSHNLIGRNDPPPNSNLQSCDSHAKQKSSHN